MNKVRETHILILAGSQEAKYLIPNLLQTTSIAQKPIKITATLAGHSHKIPDYGQREAAESLHIHVGGFSQYGQDSITGLCAFIKDQHIDMLIDVTHPYAIKMKHHALAAARALSIPSIHYIRPAWQQNNQLHWHEFNDYATMIKALPSKARLFLSVGSKGMEELIQHYDKDNHHYMLYRALKENSRLQNTNHQAMGHIDFIPFHPNNNDDGLEKLWFQHQITHLICKNSGTEKGLHKLHIARKLGIEIFMLQRPDPIKLSKEQNSLHQFIENHDFLDNILEFVGFKTI